MRNSCVRCWLAFVFSLDFCAAQPVVEAAKETAKQGFPVTPQVQVAGNVSVEAVLLPPNVTRGLFGRAVSDRYVAVQLIVSNRSDDAALIIHSLFMDYSRWLLSGASKASEIPDCEPSAQSAKPPQPGSKKPTLPQCANQLEDGQDSTKSSQIASAEFRLPRGQLLQAQPWTARNLRVRIAELAGTIAAGYVFSLSEPGFAKGVAAYNGNFLPGLRYLLPDSSIERANRISDLGYRVNKVIGKNSADVVVAFFPIDRFVTPGFRKLFEKTPAIFFVPESVALDPVAEKLLVDAVPELKKLPWKSELLKAIKTGESNDATRMFDRIGLNRIRVVVGGAMTIDTALVPASIEGITFDEADRTLLWMEPGTKTGTIRGRFLGAGKLVVADASKAQITDVAVLPEGSTSEMARFSIKLNKPVPEGTRLTFRIDKETPAKKIVEGIPHQLEVKGALLVMPAVEKIERSGDALTITGKRFFNTDENPLTVTLVAGAVADMPVKTFQRTTTQITIDLAPLKLSPACWTPRVAVGTIAAPASSMFAQPPVPKIASAKKNGNRVVITGDQFINLKPCGKELKFEIAEQAAGSAFKAVDNLTPVSAKEVSIDFPKTPAGGKFKVRVVLAGTEMDTKNVD